MVNRVVSVQNEARAKKRNYYGRRRSAHCRSVWDKTHIIATFLKYRLTHDELPTPAVLRSTKRPTGFPSYTTITNYIDYDELCEVVEEKYQQHLSSLKTKKDDNE